MQNSQYPFMPVVKARSVIWPGSQKTMGELLDNGCLTIKDLQKGIASEKDNVRIASEVLLADQSQKIRDYINKGGIPRTLDEAYEVRWPFDKRTGMPNATLREVLRCRKVCSRDLGYAINKSNAPDQLYYACVIILKSLVDKEEKKYADGRGPLCVTADYSSYMTREGEKYLQKRGLILGASLACCFFLVLGYIIWFANHYTISGFIYELINMNWLSWVILIILALIILFSINKIIDLTLFKKIDDIDAAIDANRKGKIGEDRVVEALRELLDGSCHIFRNLHIDKDKKWDVDIALVSPWGVYALEVKNLTGEYEIADTIVTKKFGKKIVKLKDRDNPVIEARRHAACLKSFLDADFSRNNDKAFVEPIVIWANPDIKAWDSKSAIKCWRIERLSEELDSIRTKQKLSPQGQKDIIKRLLKCYKN
ncbi:nuclease-related domain-containing protein [Fibrobacter sp. UWH3]|uniref:nuclease-related domain-containing protein n=1 Tax=Fibrobacter sp. UWH3 TaxID=1964353 RepID=UPI000B521A40|nr:nuclease-related domain-containing protein [Fibrobacter sp. UWH3]OWV03301.1 hypothetical protein B7993_13545 [Fibrobacter sp. UWH3]